MSERIVKDILLQHLIDSEMIEDETVDEILDEHSRTGRSVRNILIDAGMISEEELLEEIAACMGTSVVSLKDFDIPPEVVNALPISLARTDNVVAINADPTSITLATFEALSHEKIDELLFVLSKAVDFVIAPEEEIKNHLEEYYGSDSASMDDLYSELGSELEDAGELDLDKKDIANIDLEEQANMAPVVRFVNLVLYQAVNNRASDIHFEPFSNEFKIRYRVDGALYEMAPPPKHLALPVISRVKVVSGLNIAERRLPQDGRIQLNIAGRAVDFRVSTLPTQHGESVVLRVLDQSAIGLELENLGMPDDVFQWFVDDISKPNGIVVVTGPTGSGKTTTLYSGLRRINKVENKILTAEEPVEYDIYGIVQVGVNEKAGNTFAKVLRAFLRQDPDIIMVGEIRDKETAQISIQASLTGHLVFSTLHTNDASGAITRMIDMGVEPFLIASTLESVMGTRLVRTICGECKTAYEPTDEILENLDLRKEDVGDQKFYYGEGCQYCNQTGYSGRRGIYEYLRISEAIRDLINDESPTLIIREKAREQGMRTLREDGIRCILDGYTTVDEVLKYT